MGVLSAFTLVLHSYKHQILLVVEVPPDSEYHPDPDPYPKSSRHETLPSPISLESMFPKSTELGGGGGCHSSASRIRIKKLKDGQMFAPQRLSGIVITGKL